MQKISNISLKPFTQPLVDGESNPIELDAVYQVRAEDDIGAVVQAIVRRHEGIIGLMPLSGMSSGGGVFETKPSAGITPIGLLFAPVSAPTIKHGSVADITRIRTDEIIIDDANLHIYAGAGITLGQLNNALAQEFGAHYKVLGADLTSYAYAAVGATFMTGGMGPQRRYFSDSVDAIALFDGTDSRCVSGDELKAIAGTYGWGGLVTAVRCRYVELPLHEVAFALPVANTPKSIARLLAQLLPFAQLNINNSIVSSRYGDDVIMGVEHATVASMQPLLAQAGDTEVMRRATQLAKKCAAAGADGLMFINGYSANAIDEFLFNLVDDTQTETPCIAGIDLAHTEVFTDPEQMRALREAIPYAARTQKTRGRYTYKGHTDANIQLNPDCAEPAMQALWELNQRYVERVQHYFDTSAEINGELLVYGHLNPVGVDPHNRITFSCDSAQVYQQSVTVLEDYRKAFYRDLNLLCERTQSRFIGGEKGAGSEREILEAFALDAAPKIIMAKFAKQAAYIQKANPLFSWRAMPPYK